MDKVKLIIEAARRSLISFCEVINPAWETTWFHEHLASRLQNAIERVRRGEKVRIILSISPRSGKSQLASIYFPAWALGNYPDTRFILSTYGMDLSEHNGRKTRDVISSDVYEALFPGVSLREDQKAKAKWVVKDANATASAGGKEGSYTSVGIGSAVTGVGADCLLPGTMIDTLRGRIPVENCVDGDWVLSFNHERNQTEYKRVVATAKKSARDSVAVHISNGSVVRVTEDHPIYVVGRGYVPAGALAEEDSVLCAWGVQGVRGEDEESSGRVSQESDTILFKHLCERAPQQETKTIANVVRRVFGLCAKVSSKNLLQKMFQGFGGGKTRLEKEELHGVRKSISSSECRGQDVLEEVCAERARKEDARCVQRKGEKVLSSGVFESKTLRSACSRWKQVYCLFVDRFFGCAPQRRQYAEQRPIKSSDNVQAVPHRVSRVEQEKHDGVVYDLQVEDNHNFFADGVLVHNCIIIDDPHKDRAEAESETSSEAVWEYYRSTLYSRLEGVGGIIVIMQRWNDKDLVGRLLEDAEKKKAAGEPYDEWEVIKFPAIAVDDEYIDGKLVRKAGEALWPSKFPIEVLENIKSVQGAYFFQSQYQQDPIGKDTQEFDPRWFQTYDPASLAGKYLRYYTLVDPAISQKKEADNTVVLTVAKEVNGPNIYRVREEAGHYTPAQTVDIIFAHQSTYRSEVHVETIQYQAALKYAIVEEQRRREQYFTVKELKPRNDKRMRIRGLIPLYRANVIWHLPSDAGFEHELLTFPNGRRDDRADAMAHILTAMENTSSGVRQVRSSFRGYFAKR